MGLAKELNEFFASRDNVKDGYYAKDEFLHNEGYFADDDPTGPELVSKFGAGKQVSCKRIGSSYDTQQLVYSFANRPGELVAVDGYYSSWEGTDWSSAEFYDVVETEKTIKVYARAK